MAVVKVNTVPAKVVKVLGLVPKQPTDISDIDGLESSLSQMTTDIGELSGVVASFQDQISDKAPRGEAALLTREENVFTGRKIVIQPDPGSPPLVTLGRESTSWYPNIGAHGYAAALGSLLGNDASLSNNAYLLYLSEYRRIAQGFAGLIQIHLGDIIGTVAPGTGPADEDFTETRRTLFYFGNSGYIAFWGLKDNGDGVLVANNNGAVTKKAAIPRPILPVDEGYSAVAADAGKLISLDASEQAVTLTIDPALFTGMTLMIRCKDNTNGATIAVASGIIELKSGIDVTDVSLTARLTMYLYSDGTNLLEL